MHEDTPLYVAEELGEMEELVEELEEVAEGLLVRALRVVAAVFCLGFRTRV